MRRFVRFAQSGLVLATILGLASCGGGGGGSSSSPMASASQPTVVTIQGAVTGVSTTNMNKFLGIPYAAPPVGALRWQPPQPAPGWSSPRSATAFGSSCAQPASFVDQGGSAEDCLYLNVFVPVGAGPFPVMFWIHGGSLHSGTGSDFDPTALVNSGVAVVTINYRLGALGFLAHPAFAGTNGAAGNYGLMDQQAALAWVKANIAAFGGDPGNVTVFGQSAGGLSTLAHIVSPLAAGLFQKAIVESGTYDLTLPSLAAAEAQGQTFATNAGCPDQSAACLRALPVSTILANQGAIAASADANQLPTVDGVLLPTDLASALASGSFNKVPMIEGTTQHENSLLSDAAIDMVLGHQLTAGEYPTYIDDWFGVNAPNVLAQYPLTPALTPAWTYDDAVTDAVFACSGRLVAQEVSAVGATLYAYEFADANAPVVFNVPPRTDGFGAYHASEVQYVFPKANYAIYYGAPFTAVQRALSAQMVSFWSQFAKTGNPNGTGNSPWPAYTSGNDTYLTLAPGAVAPTANFATEHQCSFWNE